MRLLNQIQRRAKVRNTLLLAAMSPLAFSLVSTQAIAQGTLRGKTQNTKTVPATPASSSKTLADNPNAGPAVVATVNGTPISLSELAVQCRSRFGTDVLEDLVNKTLILQACQAQKITVTQKDIDDEIGRTASKFNLSTTMYLKLSLIHI